MGNPFVNALVRSGVTGIVMAVLAGLSLMAALAIPDAVRPYVFAAALVVVHLVVTAFADGKNVASGRMVLVYVAMLVLALLFAMPMLTSNPQWFGTLVAVFLMTAALELVTVWAWDHFGWNPSPEPAPRAPVR